MAAKVPAVSTKVNTYSPAPYPQLGQLSIYHTQQYHNISDAINNTSSIVATTSANLATTNASLVTTNASVAALNTALTALEAQFTILTAATTFYVNPIGNDSNNGLANTAGGAFKTIGGSMAAMKKIDSRGFLVTVQVAAGTYVENLIDLALVTGGVMGNAPTPHTLIGDTTTPSNVVIQGTVRSIGPGNQWFVTGFKFTNGPNGNAVWGHAQGWVRLGNVEFAAQTNFHILADHGGTVELMQSYKISGGSGWHALCQLNGYVLAVSGITVTLTGTPAFSIAFVQADYKGLQDWSGITFSGGATGSRYAIAHGAGILTASGTPTTYFPGNVAGVVDAISYGWLDDAGAWQTFTPTISGSTGGTPSTSLSGCAFTQIGKTVFYRVDITITAVGGATGTTQYTLPVPGLNPGHVAAGVYATTFAMLQATAASTTTMGIFKYDGTFLLANGDRYIIQSSYEAA